MRSLSIVIITVILGVYSVFGACPPDKPKGDRYLIFDLLSEKEKAKSGFNLSAQELNSLNSDLVQFARKTSTQIVVIVTGDICGMDAAMYATEVGEKWGVGQKGKDNGIVMVIKPTGGAGERKTFISTGYGLEPVIPDAIAKRIVEVEMIPNFKEGRWGHGVRSALDVMESLALKEFPPQEYMKQTKRKGIPFIGIIAFLVIILISVLGSAGRARRYATTHDVSFWTALFLMSQMNRRHQGYYGNFTGGSGGFGGGSSGGFGGFGGGSFGGGGAGGSW